MLLDDAAAAHPQPSSISPQLIAEAQAEFGAQDGDSAAPPAGPPGWDARVHASPPVKTTRGTWKLLPGKRASDAQPGAQLTDAAASPSALDAAGAMTDTCFALAGALLGPDWQPTPDERSNITAALTRYYEVHGAIDLPPGAALLLAIGAYALPRALLPSTRQRIAQAVAQARGLFGGRLPKQTPADAQSDAGEREGLARAA